MFKNILHDPHNVTEQELIFLDQRRKMEKQMILDKDILSQEMDDDADKEGDSDDDSKKHWFMISGDWLFQWKCFISNKISSSAKVSQEVKNQVQFSTNKEIGILPPGPIYNQDFYTRQ